MYAVRCPACNERVEGRSSEDLTRSVEMHLSDVHQVSGGMRREEASPEEFRGGANGFTEASPSGGTPVGPEQGRPGQPINPTPGGGIGAGGKVDEKEKSFEVSDTRDMQGMGGRSSGIVEPMGRGSSGTEDTRGISERGLREGTRAEDMPSSERGTEFIGGADDMSRMGSRNLGSRPTPGGGISPGGKVDYKEKSFEVSATSATMGMGGSETGIVTPEGTGGDEDTRGISGFQCPICGSEISGESEQEMTSSFKSHLSSAHSDEPFVTRIMERVGSR